MAGSCAVFWCYLLVHESVVESVAVVVDVDVVDVDVEE